MDKSRINRVVVKEFDRLAYLTSLEMDVLTTRAAGKARYGNHKISMCPKPR